MAIPQGSTVLNTQYFSSLAARANEVSSCAQLQSLYTDMTASVTATKGAMTSQLSAVQSQVTLVANQLSTLSSHIATLAASEAGMTLMGTVGATAAAVTDLSSAIVYIKAQGLAQVSMGTTSTASFVQQALALKADYDAITAAYNLIVNQVSNLTSQISGITTQLTSLQGTMTTIASRFPSCTL